MSTRSSVVVLGFAFASCLPALGAPVLEVYGTSLTTYKAGTTLIQGVKPLFNQRGTGIDGTLRAGPTFRWALAGNPSGDGWARQGFVGSIRLDTGAYAPTDVDLSLPAKMPWTVGRTYNAVQDSSGHLDSNGYQGRNWFQTSQPEIVFFDADGNSGTLQAADLVYLVYGADRYAEFKRTADNDTTFKGKNGAAGAFKVTSGSPDVWTYYDQNGWQTSFFGFNTTSNATNGQVWKIVDPEGTTAYVGDATTASTAITNGYTSGKISKAYDSSDRRYTYTYTTIDSVSRLTQVVCETKESGTWAAPADVATVGQVNYAYYQTGDNTEGDNGCLKLVTVTTPTSNGTTNLVSKKYYRYWKGAFNASTNPGNPYQIKLILGFEGSRKYDWDQDSILDDDFLTASTSALQSYSDAYIEYTGSSDYRVAKAFFNGECGCSGGNNGTYFFTYGNETNYGTKVGNTTYDNTWATRTVVKQPDLVYFTQYFDEVGQPLARVVTSTDPAVSVTTRWVTNVQRDASGLVSTKDMPDRNDTSASGYTHSTGAITAKTGAGIIGLTAAVDVTSAPTDLAGFTTGGTLQVKGTGTGTDASPLYTNSTDWQATPQALTVGTTTVVRPFVDNTKAYFGVATSKGSAGTYNQTSYTYTFWSATTTDPLYITPQKIVTTLPAVTTSNNGSNTSNTTERYLNKDGTTAFTKAADGVYAYSEYNSNGQLTKSIQDPKSGSSETTMNTAATTFSITLPSNGTHLVTTYTYDAQGRLETTTLPDGRVTKNFTTVLADGRIARLSAPRVASGTTYYGPASYSVVNQAGQAEFSATVGITAGSTTTALSSWLTSASDPITAILGSGALGSANCTLSGLSTTVYSSDGRKRLYSRTYMANPSTLPGTLGTNYDETAYGYDDMGRNWRVLTATGTIQRTVYDTLGRATERWIGTNDKNFTGGSASGTDNMTKTDTSQYDGGASGGNSLLTTRTIDADGDWTTTTDQRVTTFYYDGRGRVVSTVNPLAPHTVTNYDNVGRATSTAQYSSSSGLDANSVTSTTTNRIAFMETAFDEMGRVWKTTRHKITQSSGADADNLTNKTWYDAAGRVIKTKGEGGISKTKYDRLGRAIRRYTLASDLANAGGLETSYADAGTVADDQVLEETISNFGNTDYYNSGKVTMSATIQRWHDDTTTVGDLDTNGDTDDYKFTEGDIKGRISIAVSFIDELGRTTDTVAYGTNGFTGSGSATFVLMAINTTPTPPTFTSVLTIPTRSSTALRTTTVYNTNGTVQTVESPGTPGSTTATTGIKTKYLYDDANRKTAEIRNYTGGATTTANRDTDLYTRYVYTTGLMTKMWVDLDADNVQDTDDQVTTYTYGTTKSATLPDSKIATGHLLFKVTYPDSTGSTDLVTYAYNAQSQQIYVKDQAASVIETDYDTLGRQTQRRATTIASGLDTTIKRIATVYLSRGLVDTVTQYDNATVGSGTAQDQVQYTYDDWGNLTKFEQDVDSAIGVSGRAAFNVQYTWIKRNPTQGFDTLARQSLTLPDGTSLSYNYDTGSTAINQSANRVKKITFGLTDLASYDYLGAGQLVGQTLPEPNVKYLSYATATPHAYANLDRFGRVLTSAWTNGVSGGTDFYHVDLTYDNVGNIMAAKDTVHADTSGVRRFDASYSMDALSRLSRAEEGNWNGTSISTRRRDEQWKDGSGNLALSQTGNWARRRLDLNGDGVFTGTNELDDTGTFNTANEWLTRDTDTNGTANYTLTHDAVGNMTDDGKNYTYVYDVFGRLATVKTRGGSPVAVVEYKYNGLGYRTGWHYDADEDKTLESGAPGDDPWYYFCYDERWRTVATYRYTDSSPKEQYVYNAAGARGLGGSSYIDSVVLRDRDINSGWRSAGDGTLEERRYYAQNWRADVSVILPSTGCAGGIKEWIKYSAYGVPQAFSMADYNRDGTKNATDGTDFTTDYNAANLRADVDFNGTVNATDQTLFNAATSEAAARGTLSCAGTANRIGYAGYLWDPAVSVNHVRHRVYVPELGRWTRRDPLGYVDGMGLYEYVRSKPCKYSDAYGLESPFNPFWPAPGEIQPPYPLAPTLSPPTACLVAQDQLDVALAYLELAVLALATCLRAQSPNCAPLYAAVVVAQANAAAAQRAFDLCISTLPPTVTPGVPGVRPNPWVDNNAQCPLIGGGSGPFGTPGEASSGDCFADYVQNISRCRGCFAADPIQEAHCESRAKDIKNACTPPWTPTVFPRPNGPIVIPD